jgi:hypothetical protein
MYEQEILKFEQESEKKELLLCVVAKNFFDSGFPIDKIAEYYNKTPKDIRIMIDRTRNSTAKSGT